MMKSEEKPWSEGRFCPHPHLSSCFLNLLRVISYTNQYFGTLWSVFKPWFEKPTEGTNRGTIKYVWSCVARHQCWVVFFSMVYSSSKPLTLQETVWIKVSISISNFENTPTVRCRLLWSMYNGWMHGRLYIWIKNVVTKNNKTILEYP